MAGDEVYCTDLEVRQRLQQRGKELVDPATRQTTSAATSSAGTDIAMGESKKLVPNPISSCCSR
jgi:hypothetical protein